MGVAFKIRRADVKRLFALAEKHKPPENEDWLVFIKVEDYLGSFQAGRECAEYPVQTISAGSAELPLSMLREVSIWSKAKEVEITVHDGHVACEKKSVESEHIRVGLRLNPASDYVTYPTRQELIVISRAMDKTFAEAQGLEPRFQNAEASLQFRIAQATSLLAPYGVEYGDVEKLANTAIKGAEPRIRAKLMLN
jgi:hypothetical protein